MRKLLMVALLSNLFMGILKSQETNPIIGTWECGEKALDNGVEKTEYWIITESSLLMVTGKDNSTATYDEVHELTNGFDLDVTIEGNLIKAGESEAMQIKILEVDDKTAVLEAPFGKETKTVKLKRLVK